jgi:esterase/lipase
MFSFKVTTYGKKNNKVVFVFSGWKNTQWQFWFVGKTLQAYGYKAFIYTYDPAILTPDTKQTVKNFAIVKKDVLQRITALPKKEQKNMSVFGTSLGTLLAFMVADEVKNVTKIIANLSGADVAKIVWSWDSIEKRFKDRLRKQRITLPALQTTWASLSPINNLSAIHRKDVLLYAAEKDEVIPYEQAKELIEACKAKNPHTEAIINSRHSHIMSGLINVLRYETYIHFLNTEKRIK